MKKSPSARAQSLLSLAKVLEAKRQDIAASIQVQTGGSVDEAEKEMELSISRLNDWSAYCDKIQGGSLVIIFLYYTKYKGWIKIIVIRIKSNGCVPLFQPMPQSGSALSFPEALGVVGVVLPDKNPLLSMVTLLGAAIATGNAVIMVPSQKHPLPALEFVQVSV